LFIALNAEGASITVTAIDALSFGKIAVTSTGAVTVSPTGARTKSGGVGLLSSSSGRSARFQITGDPSASFIISLPGDSDATLTSGGSSLSLSQFTANIPLSGALDGTGAQIFTVGATLAVDPSKQAADYSGSYSVIVNYQ
jgi:hypothetical protein